MIKKITILVLSLFLLVSCWDTDVSWWTGLKAFENNDFSMYIPNSWIIINNDDKVLPKPKNWEISLAVSSTDINYWFSNNLLVLKQKLNKETTSRKFAIINNVWAAWEYKNYTLLETKDISFWDIDNSKVYVFEAKYNELTPQLKFVQTSVVCWKTWYLLTIALALDTKTTDKYVDLLKTFRCK